MFFYENLKDLNLIIYEASSNCFADDKECSEKALYWIKINILCKTMSNLYRTRL